MLEFSLTVLPAPLSYDMYV